MEAKSIKRKESDKGKALSFTVPWGRRMIEISSPHVSLPDEKMTIICELTSFFRSTDAGIRSTHEFQQLHERSPLVSLHIASGLEASSPDESAFAFSHRNLSGLLGNGIFTTDGVEWQSQRKVSSCRSVRDGMWFDDSRLRNRLLRKSSLPTTSKVSYRSLSTQT